MQREENYICSNCGIHKTDTNSRYSFVDITLKEKLCWECTRISEAKRTINKILKNITKEFDRIDDIQSEIKQYIKIGGKE